MESSSPSDAIRRRLEEREDTLSPYASRSGASRGRLVPEEPSPMRTAYQRDRDRILHAKAFRRLKHKTQVFLAPLGDHYVTRLTHTLEVAQISRSIARALNLNEDLTEAIALGHDLGHTPFGHAGEATLNELAPGGFSHSVHSVRIVDVLEKNGAGLNLTWETRQGMQHHSKPRGDFLGSNGSNGSDESGAPLTLEAQVCRIADAVAYLNHDIDDAIRAGVLRESDLPSEAVDALGNRSSRRLNSMVSNVVIASWAATGEVPLPSYLAPSITMTPQMRRVLVTLREFLFERVYLPAGNTEEGRAAHRIMRLLCHHFAEHPEEVPEEYHTLSETPERRAVDYIASMTDQYALRAAEHLEPGSTAAFRDRLV